MIENEVEYKIGHSPDPDDAFMFYALTKGSLKTENRAVAEKLAKELYKKWWYESYYHKWRGYYLGNSLWISS